MQHQNQDLGRSHGHGGLHQAEGLHQERPTVKNKNAHQLGKRNLCKIHIRLMLAFKTRKNSLTVRKQTIGLKMSKWSAQVTIVKTDMGQTSRQTGSTQKCVKEEGSFWLLSGGDAVQYVGKARRQEGRGVLVGL